MAKSQTGSRNPDGVARRPDPTRIAGISGTLLLNGCAALLLLVPMTQPALRALPDRVPDLVWIDPRPVPPPLPPEPVARVPTPVVRAAPRPPVAPPPETAAPTRDLPSMPAPATDVATLPAAALAGSAASTPASTPAAGARLAYASAPPPAYPRLALRDGSEGTVVLEVLVGSDGRPREVRVHASSGDRRLDEAARRQVLRQWRFVPAIQDGRAVDAIGLVPVDFHLGRG